MKVLIRNIVNDSAGKELRRKNPTKVVPRPRVCGRVLPPTATRVLRTSQVTSEELRSLKNLVAAGCIQLTITGIAGVPTGIVSVTHLAKLLGLPIADDPPKGEKSIPKTKKPSMAERKAATLRAAPAPTPAPEPEPEPAPEPEPVRARDEEGHFVGDDPSTPEVDEAWVSPEEDTDEAGEPESTDESPEVVEDSGEEQYTDSELMAMLKSELVGLLGSLGGDASGLTKRQLTDKILSLQEN